MATKSTVPRRYAGVLRRITGTATTTVVVHFILLNVALNAAASALYDLAKWGAGKPPDWNAGNWLAVGLALIVPAIYICCLVTWAV